MSHNLGLNWDDTLSSANADSHNNNNKNNNDNSSFHSLKPHRHVAMKRDRSIHRDEREDRGNLGREPRIAASEMHHRVRSPSPYSRRPRGHRDEDGYHEERSMKEGGEKACAFGTNDQSGDNHHSEGVRASQLPPLRGEPHDDIDRPRPIPTSPRHGPASGKRRRSRSPPPFPPTRPKKSRRDRNHRSRAERGPPKKPGHPRHERPTSPFSARSPSPNRDPRDRYNDRVEPSGPHRSRHRSRSPFGPQGDFEWGPPPPSHPRNDLPPRDRSHSPRSNSRRSSFSRAHSSPRPPTRSHPGLGEVGSHSRRSPLPYDPPPRSDHPPRSPRERGSRRARKRGKRRDDSRFFPGGDIASGANSVEVNMSRRGGFRGSFDSQMPPSHPTRSRYDDPRYGQSPLHANSVSSFHGSPGSQSPHGSRRGSRNGQAQYSPDE